MGVQPRDLVPSACEIIVQLGHFLTRRAQLRAVRVKIACGSLALHALVEELFLMPVELCLRGANQRIQSCHLRRQSSPLGTRLLSTKSCHAECGRASLGCAVANAFAMRFWRCASDRAQVPHLGTQAGKLVCL